MGELQRFRSSLLTKCSIYRRSACTEYAKNYLDHLMLLTDQERRRELQMHTEELIQMEHHRNKRHDRHIHQRIQTEGALKKMAHSHHEQRLKYLDDLHDRQRRTLEQDIKFQGTETDPIRPTLTTELSENWINPCDPG